MPNDDSKYRSRETTAAYADRGNGAFEAEFHTYLVSGNGEDNLPMRMQNDQAQALVACGYDVDYVS